MTRVFRTLPAACAVPSLSLLAFAAVSLPVTAAQAQEVRITPTASLTEEWTDNVGGVADGGTRNGDDDSDFITTLNAGVGATVDGARTSLSARYQFGYDLYASNDELNGIRHSLAGTGRYEAIDDHLFLDANTALSQRSIGVGPRTATDRTTGDDQTTLWTYALGPTWRQHLSDFADARASYRLVGANFFETDVGDAGDDSRPEDTLGHEISGNLTSGEMFGRFSWDVGTLLANYYNEGELREERRTVSLGTEYRVSPEVGLLLSTGYDDIQFHETEEVTAAEAEGDSVSAPFWTVGLRYNPSPNLDTRVEAGQRYEDPYYTGSIGWDISPRTNLTASYTMDVVTQQQALIDSQCADPDDPFCLPLEEDLTNDSFRRQTLSVRFTHRYERTTYGLSGSWVVREFSDTEGDDDSTLQFLASANHNLTPQTSGFVQIGYTLGDTTGNGSTGGGRGNDEVQTLRGSVGLTQQLSENLSGSLSYSHLRREDEGTDTSSENSIVARIAATF